jgi:hypothetical protein
MWGLIFSKLQEVAELKQLDGGEEEFRKSAEFKKITQIATQYEQKYRKDLQGVVPRWKGFPAFEGEMVAEIRRLFESIRGSKIEEEKVIILDYLISLRQLSNLLAKNDIDLFHKKSKIETIVEGAPAKVITEEHFRAITAKLKAIKLI